MKKFIGLFVLVVTCLLLTGCPPEEKKHAKEANDYWGKMGVSVEETICEGPTAYEEIEISNDGRFICFIFGRDSNGVLDVYSYGSEKNTKKLNLDISGKLEELQINENNIEFYYDGTLFAIKYELGGHYFFIDLTKRELTIHFLNITYELITGNERNINRSYVKLNKDEYNNLLNYLTQTDFSSLCEEYGLNFVSYSFSEYGIISNFQQQIKEAQIDDSFGLVYMIFGYDNQNNEKIIIYPNPVDAEPFVINPEFKVSYLESKNRLIDEGKNIVSGSLSISIREKNTITENQPITTTYEESINYVFIDDEDNEYLIDPYK